MSPLSTIDPIEQTCLMTVQEHLDDGETTVGLHVCVSHSAAELVAMGVAIVAVVIVTLALLGRGTGSTSLATTPFLVLLTLIVVVFDRSLGIHRDRERAGMTAGTAGRAALTT